jgi:hypothetical protein
MITLSIMALVLLCCVSFMLNAVMLSIENEPFMVIVVMLNVVAPILWACTIKLFTAVINSSITILSIMTFSIMTRSISDG